MLGCNPEFASIYWISLRSHKGSLLHAECGLSKLAEQLGQLFYSVVAEQLRQLFYSVTQEQLRQLFYTSVLFWRRSAVAIQPVKEDSRPQDTVLR